jgi:HPt (histidine-containing phosphotransfer) domain-containing protein
MNNETDKSASVSSRDQTGPAAAPWTLPQALAELWDAGQSEVVMELIHLFLTDTRERLDLLQQALAARELDKLRRMAHSIKGSCSQMGETRMAQIGMELEEIFCRGSFDGSEPLVAALLRQFESSARSIRAFVEKHG